jgi:hypothetical protein
VMEEKAMTQTIGKLEEQGRSNDNERWRNMPENRGPRLERRGVEILSFLRNNPS